MRRPAWAELRTRTPSPHPVTNGRPDPPLGLALGIPAPLLIALWPAVNGYFLLPTCGTFITAINFDRTGTTRVGRFVVNRSFMLPGLVTTCVAVSTGFALIRIV
ncbi:hypothetical protein OG264_16740 [Streptomyces xanthophaeus]|uniref:hypothetical protein n=1 Tax=Streptomyces xanthophaeus TaxID=67385 RepID=UPI003863F5AF|nr:hypothetical protein OG264_16740 [Streptomyces xanthophaeus]WST62029.1 hypothetical protein OG605_21695 [Streptomyces xanthophaeus]